MSVNKPENPISDEILVDLDKRGFVPGPDESEEAFLGRVRDAQRFAEELPLELAKEESEFPFKVEDSIPGEHLDESLDAVEEIYGIRPEWVPAYYNNKGLSIWHGGGTWILEMEGYEYPVSLFQLRSQFRNRSRYLRLYQRDELLTHEYCHVGRMAFEESAFEEVLSYATSKSGFRRHWGGIFQSNLEVLVFFLFLALALVFPNLVEVWESLEPLILPVMALPFVLTMGGVFRLMRRHRVFQRCVQRLSELYEQPMAIVYRMTDDEIWEFSKLEADAIKARVNELAETSLRWRVIRLRFT